MKNFAILIFLAIFFCGCSSTYTVRSTAAEDSYNYEQMNEKLKGQNATIELRDGREMYAKEVQIANDSVSGIDVRTDVKSKVSILQLNKILIYENALGVWEGLGLGLLGGVTIGVIGGISGSAGRLGRDVDIYGGAIVFGFVGAFVGLLTVGIIGHRDIYEFPIEQPTDSLRNKKSP